PQLGFSLGLLTARGRSLVRWVTSALRSGSRRCTASFPSHRPNSPIRKPRRPSAVGERSGASSTASVLASHLSRHRQESTMLSPAMQDGLRAVNGTRRRRLTPARGPRSPSYPISGAPPFVRRPDRDFREARNPHLRYPARDAGGDPRGRP